MLLHYWCIITISQYISTSRPIRALVYCAGFIFLFARPCLCFLGKPDRAERISCHLSHAFSWFVHQTPSIPALHHHLCWAYRNHAARAGCGAVVADKSPSYFKYLRHDMGQGNRSEWCWWILNVLSLLSDVKHHIQSKDKHYWYHFTISEPVQINTRNH